MNVKENLSSAIIHDAPVRSRESAEYWGSDAFAAILRELDIPYISLNPGASTPYHTTTSTPLIPASLMVGTSGSWSERLGPRLASGRSRPAFTWADMAGMLA